MHTTLIDRLAELKAALENDYEDGKQRTEQHIADIDRILREVRSAIDGLQIAVGRIG